MLVCDLCRKRLAVKDFTALEVHLVLLGVLKDNGSLSGVPMGIDA